MHRAKRGSSTVLARPYRLQAVLPAACISSLLAFLNFPFQIVLRIIAFSYTALSKSRPARDGLGADNRKGLVPNSGCAAIRQPGRTEAEVPKAGFVSKYASASCAELNFRS